MPIVEIPHALFRFTEERNEVAVSGETLGEALDDLWRQFPKLRSRVLGENGEIYPYLLLFHNNEKVERANFDQTTITPDDKIEIVAMAEGG